MKLTHALRAACPARARHGPRRLVGRQPRLRDDLHLPDGRGDLFDVHVPRRRRLAYGSGGAAYYILGDGTLAYVLSYYLLPAVWRFATPRRLVSQADVFTSAYGSRALGVVVSVVAAAPARCSARSMRRSPGSWSFPAIS